MAVSYKSDYIRPTGNGGGRPFDTHGARFDNGMVFVNEGLSHEENPNGGVQVGVDENGKPNLVEQGEVIVDLGGGPYVMSQRLRLGREDLLMAGLPVKYAGKTCAEAATGMQRESEERPLDEISMRGLRAMLERLAAVQETYRDDIGVRGTQNLNLGQDLYGARAQAVGSEEEMGQMPIESEAEGGYAAYGGWSLKKKDMPPYGYYQYGSIPEYGYAPRYDGLQNIPPENIGFINGALVGPYVGVPAARSYPASYPYPVVPVQRQMAYGGYRFDLDDETFDLGNGEKLINKNGSYIYYKPGSIPRAISSEEAQEFINKMNAAADNSIIYEYSSDPLVSQGYVVPEETTDYRGQTETGAEKDKASSYGATKNKSASRKTTQGYSAENEAGDVRADVPAPIIMEDGRVVLPTIKGVLSQGSTGYGSTRNKVGSVTSAPVSQPARKQAYGGPFWR